MSVRSTVPARISPPPADAVPRLMAGAHDDGTAISLGEHVRRYGELPRPSTSRPSGNLIPLVEASGLRGRGGGGFPTARKLRAVAEGGRRPVVLANGAEGEPVSGKDKVLMRYMPHLVLDGIAVAAAAVGARDAFVVVGSDSPETVAAMQAAIAERGRHHLDRVSISLRKVPAGFVAGEETALVNWLNGGSLKPTFTPPRPFERGIGGAPTLVQNVETLANLALIARFGAEWFRSLGTTEEPGSALVTLGGAVAQPGIYEIPLGLSLSALIERAGGLSRPVSALLIGGYFGAWVSAGHLDSVVLLDSTLRSFGASLGARAIFALPENVCGIVETARLSRYLADQSAGQCGPCKYGLDAIATALGHLAWSKNGKQFDDSRLDRWINEIEGRGACRHPDGATRLIASGLNVFAEERIRHARGSCSCNGKPLLPVGVQRARR